MNAARRAALALALLVLPVVLPVASAGIPEPLAWSPWTAPQPVNDVALADRGDTIAAALAAYTAASGCLPPQCTAPVNDPQQRYDLAVLTVGRGFVAANTDNLDDVTPDGRSHVAVSADGTTHVSIGLDTQVGSTSSVPQLYYSRAGQGNNWTIAGSNLTRYLDGTPMGVLVSQDGRRVAVLSDLGGNISVKGFTFNNGILSLSFDFTTPGRPFHAAADADLARVLVAARSGAAGGNRSMVLLIPFDQGVANAPYYAAEGVNLTRVASSASGARFAVGGSNGTLLLFRGGLTQPEPLSAGNATVDRLAISADGTRLAAAANATLRAFDIASQPALERYTTSLPGAARGLDYNATGGILAAATSAGVIGYGDAGQDLGWGLRGDTSDVDINADGSIVVYAQRNRVFAVAVPRGLVLSYEGGLDYGASRTVQPGGNATYDLFVRNPGAAPERVVFEGPDDLDVDVAFDPPLATVNPGETTRVVATLTPGQLQAGSRSVVATARSLTSGLADTAVLNFTIAAFVDVELVLNVTDVLAKPGEEHVLLMGIRNSGSRDVAVSLRAEQSVSAGPAWNVSIDPQSLTLAPNSITTVRLTVVPPANAADGTSSAVTFFLEGAEVGDQARVVYRINPKLGVEITPFARVKYVEAGTTGTFNLSVANSGSLPRRFEVYYEINETSGRPWLVRMPQEPFRLDPGQARNLTIEVAAPLEARPPDQLKFTVWARLLPEGDEPDVRASVPLFANAAEPVREDEDKDEPTYIPLPSAALATAGVAAAAALLARRRRAP